MNNRRMFIKNSGLFAFAGLLGGVNALAENMNNSTNANKGLVLQKEQGEVVYIGNRKGKVTIKVSRQLFPDATMSLLTELVPPGDGIPEHKHLHEDEFLYIHSGKAMLTVGDNKEVVEAGGLAYVPKKMWHSLTNVGDEDVLFYFGYSPAGFEAYFKAIGTVAKEKSLHLTKTEWDDINQRFGVVYR